MSISADGLNQRRAFSLWLRTGRRPGVGDDGTELKFNPWHDPEDGKFTHAGAGRYFGPGSGKSTDRPKANNRLTQVNDRVAAQSREKSQSTSLKPRSQGALRKIAEFADGVGDGLHDVGKDTITGLSEVLTTNPITTGRSIGLGLVRKIDDFVADQDTPARIHIRRAVQAAANASAHDIGYVTGRVTGNVALTAAPGAVVSKVSAVRRVAALRPRETFHPHEISWVKETLGKDGAAKAYNDSATGARAGQAPALMRSLPDGKRRPVKFDGIEGDYVIDRKMSIPDRPRARAQILRQSEALTQNRAIATWEFPNAKEAAAARKLLQKMNVRNIKVRIVKP